MSKPKVIIPDEALKHIPEDKRDEIRDLIKDMFSNSNFQKKQQGS